MASELSWKPLSLFYVEYPIGDRFGKLLAYSSMVPIFIIISNVTLIVSRRDLHTLFYFLGCLSNELSNYALKSLIMQQRPFPSLHPSIESSGMPSNHAQFMGFFCAYTTLFLSIRLSQRSLSRRTTLFIYLLCISTTLIVCYSRVYLLYHTLFQVIVGITVGGLFGTVWFLVVHYALTPIFPRITDSCIGQFLMLQDFTHINNFVQFEYTVVRNHIRIRPEVPM
ncbi:Dolichyldiphosphatase 1 isoform 3 [Schistosoma japonicum]|uniref:Dolichyldiphosphatase n=2 Tax=Schistosoma japonicum TaxID=6182 RepID=A0A4Z2CZD7_SCHJA|nr:Dolichyldiphosphatase 1 isoform 3 [Schistosoma japonicum]